MNRGGWLLAALALAASPAIFAAEAPAGGTLAVKPGEFAPGPPTFESLSFVWRIEGDANSNASCSVEFRKQGAEEWRRAQPLLRVENATHPKYNVAYGNMLAGSILGLERGTVYEMRLTLSDPDGGGDMRRLMLSTRLLPPKRITGIKVLPPGTYKVSDLRVTSGSAAIPVGYRGEDPEKVIVVTDAKTGLDLRSSKHFHLENVTVKGGRTAIDIRGSEGVCIRGCRISAEYIGILGQGAAAKNAWIADNVIRMAAKWDGKGRAGGGGYGISINGKGHVIEHNLIADCWDGISLAPEGTDPSVETSDVDIIGNDIVNCVDDGMELDYVRTNIRVIGNRLTNVGSALSVQPAFGGPVYLIRNDIYNCRLKPFKFHVDSSGILAYHNTSVASGDAWSGGDWSNSTVLNNLVLGQKDFRTVATRARGSLVDFNGWSAGALDFGETKHGPHVLTISESVFERCPMPHPGQGYEKGYGKPYPPETRDLRLKAGSPPVDAGTPIPNISDAFTGKAPDLGAHEVGENPPRYGPRPLEER